MMPNDLPGRDWPDVWVVDKDVRRIRERTRAKLALIIVVGVISGVGAAVLYRVFWGEWGWPTGLLLGLSIRWVSDIIRHYFGRGPEQDDEIDLF
jgi:hypothetical protein